MSRRATRQTQEIMLNYTLLGQKVSGKDKILRLFSCMNEEIREKIGGLMFYHALYNCEDFKDEIKALMVYAKVTWKRKELTDLALKVGTSTKFTDFENLDEMSDNDNISFEDLFNELEEEINDL